METVLRYVELIVKPSTTAQDIRKDRIIYGEWANTHAANPGAFVLGASYFRYIENPIRMSTLNETASAHMGFNASRVSSLYQNDLTEVRVNALCGYMLIRYA